MVGLKVVTGEGGCKFEVWYTTEATVQAQIRNFLRLQRKRAAGAVLAASCMECQPDRIIWTGGIWKGGGQCLHCVF